MPYLESHRGPPTKPVPAAATPATVRRKRKGWKPLIFFGKATISGHLSHFLPSSWETRLERFSKLSVLILRSDTGFLIFPWPRKMTKLKKKSSSEQTDLGRTSQRLWERLLLNLAICIMDWEKAENVFLLKNVVIFYCYLERGYSLRSSLLEPHLGYWDQFVHFGLLYVSSPLPSLQSLAQTQQCGRRSWWCVSERHCEPGSEGPIESKEDLMGLLTFLWIATRNEGGVCREV